MRYFIFMFFLLLTFVGCEEKVKDVYVVVTVTPTARPPTPVVTRAVIPKETPRQVSTQEILSAVDFIRATYVTTDDLFVDEEKLKKYCYAIEKQGYNVAFVNVQARGYYLAQTGFKVGNVLFPGHPHIKAKHPLLTLRNECGQLRNPVAVIPWIEYNWMADVQSNTGKFNLQGKGFDDTGKLVDLKFYDDTGGEPKKYANVFQTVYPYSWYLKRLPENRMYVGNYGTRWLDARKQEVQNLQMALAEQINKDYGPIQNWDRMRFPDDSSLGLKEEIQKEDNEQAKAVQRLSKYLQGQGGQLWLTVVRPDYKNPKGPASFRMRFGQHWDSPLWVKHVQYYIPMTYHSDLASFKADVNFIKQESQRLGYKFIPIVGVDNASAYEISQNAMLQTQRDFVLQQKGTSITGLADWYFDVSTAQ